MPAGSEPPGPAEQIETGPTQAAGLTGSAHRQAPTGPSTPSPSTAPSPLTEETFRLHPLTPLALGGRVLGLVVAFTLFSLIGQHTGEGGLNLTPFIIYAALAVVVIGRGAINVAVTRYHLLGGELRIEYGLLQKQSKRVRLNRVQSVDILEPLAARVFGLAEVKVTTAGTERAAVRLRYVSRPVAQALRADLLGRSTLGVEGTAEAPERPIVVVPHGQLVRAVLLEMVSWRLVFLLIGPILSVIGQSHNHQSTIGLGVAIFVSFAVIILHSIWRRVSTLWGFTVADSPDGLRISHGLLSTSRQTVPPGRIQAILIHQPLAWRFFGWAQVRMNVAGYAGNANAKSTMLIPVTDRAYAAALVGWVLGGVDIDTVPLTRPPARAALRSPWWWRFQSAGSDERVFVVRHGMLSRTVDIVPHERTQSVRLAAGPLERALGLASLHLDSTRGPVKTRVSNRDAGEARVMLDQQIERARRARNLVDGSPLAPPPVEGLYAPG
jgi:putative membrane protein